MVFFPQINAGYKISVDPEKNSEHLTHEMTSDEFFEQKILISLMLSS